MSEKRGATFDERVFIDTCQKLGRQYLLERKLKNPESVSKPLFEAAVKLARNLGLIGAEDGMAERRVWFAQRLRALLARIDTVEASAAQALPGSNLRQHMAEGDIDVSV